MVHIKFKKGLAFLLSFVMFFVLTGTSVTANTDQNAEDHVSISVETFTLGQGYHIEPKEVSLNEDDTVGKIVARTLGSGNYNDGEDSGNISYLSNVKHQDSKVNIPSYIKDEAGTINGKNNEGWLGEFDYTDMSGWMYSVNNEMPSVGMAQYEPENGDVIRVQFTVHGYGADLGFGFGESYIETANKDSLTSEISKINSNPDKNDVLADPLVAEEYEDAYDALTYMEASQESVDEAESSLLTAIELMDVDKTVLESAINEAQNHLSSASISKNGEDIDPSNKWVTQSDKDSYQESVNKAKNILEDRKATQSIVDEALESLTEATNTFNSTKKDGNKQVAPTVTLEEINTAVDEASNNIIESGINSEWETIGLVQAGKELSTSYKEDYFINQLNNQVLNASRVKITDVSRLTIAASSMGLDATNISETNLVEQIYNSANWSPETDSMTAQGINGPIYALIALDSMDFSVPSDAKWTREKLLNHIKQEQNPDGSWSLFGTSPSYDLTAMALISLAPYVDDNSVNSAVQDAVNFLSESQGKSGGFNDPWNGGVSSETTSQVVIGLSSLGIDPTSSKFTKNGNHLVSHLLSFQTEDGGFKHLQDGGSNGMATEQAIQALVAYQMFLEEEGHLYQFSAPSLTLAVDGIEDQQTFETQTVTLSPKAKNGFGEELNPKVMLNDEEVQQNSNGSFELNLNEGVNEVKVSVTDDRNRKKELNYQVYYEKSEEEEEEQGEDKVDVSPEINDGNAELMIENVDHLNTGATVSVNLDQSSINVSINNELLKKLKEKSVNLAFTTPNAKVETPIDNFNSKGNVELSIQEVDGIDGASSKVFDFKIMQNSDELSNFNEPVRLTFNLLNKSTDLSNLSVYYYNPEGEWELVGGSIEDNWISAETSHFSTFAVFNSDNLPSSNDGTENEQNNGNEEETGQGTGEDADNQEQPNEESNQQSEENGQPNEDNANNNQSNDEVASGDQADNDALPQTGVNDGHISIIGGILLLFGLSLYILSRRSQKSSQ